MASGVKVCDEVKDIFNEMKVVKADSDPKERIRFVQLEIADGYIKIAKIHREKCLEGQDIYQFFLQLLKPKVCGYLLYDCHFNTSETGVKQELVFVMWAPEDAPIKKKMEYASSKDALKKTIGGTKHEMQINELADCNNRDQFAQMLGKNLTHLEGVPVRC
ncbi:non-muscle cofilin 1-like [Betta splendens]|uniref:Non-muscle cofilin 1-like n=1 Tax=Betta splendens TaxID=158456 RepID=A0A6P7PEH0_BETSP|nr:non-muscle cofilin 1-like [Betta splendens]